MHRFEAINVSYLLFEHKNDAKDCARAQTNTHTLRYTYDEIPKKIQAKKLCFRFTRQFKTHPKCY